MGETRYYILSHLRSKIDNDRSSDRLLPFLYLRMCFRPVYSSVSTILPYSLIEEHFNTIQR